ncbi:dihydrofolate reductase [Malassezia caprae]|uniref:Dihydrofolate reductase n=1 Tax=Malassezia caprae TaxID=1381934 RepID=A0AAF0E9G3_9BASI|nr:dihydrofolate reductase [Malassezia caprae]
MATPTPKKLRVLLLHGYAMNQFSFRKRLAALQKECKDVADFVFANGPHHVQAFPSATNPDPPLPNPDDPLEKQPRAWWMSREEGYVGWDSAIKSLAQLSREQGPFDGVIGFSQGGCAAAVVAAAIERPELLPKHLEAIQTTPLKFMISVSGFRPQDPTFDALFSAPLQTPSLIIYGQNDSIVQPERTQTLIDLCAHARVVQHPGEHYLPTPF